MGKASNLDLDKFHALEERRRRLNAAIHIGLAEGRPVARYRWLRKRIDDLLYELETEAHAIEATRKSVSVRMENVVVDKSYIIKKISRKSKLPKEGT